MIRLSTSQMYSSSMNGILQSNNRLNTVNNQMTSGKRVLSPADDPVAAAQTLNSKTRMAIVEQYNRNLDFGDKNLSLTESVLDQTETALIGLKERAIQLGSDQWNDDQIKASGVEVREMLNHLKGMLNTRNESGEYIFAGSQAGQRAYEGNIFQGDSVEREAQVADDTFIKMLTSGARVFESLEVGPDKLQPTYDPNKVKIVPDPDEDTNFLKDADDNFVLDAAGDKIPDPAKFDIDKLGNYSLKEDYDTTLGPIGSVVELPDPSNTGFTDDPEKFANGGAYPNNMLGVIQYFVDATGNGNPETPVDKEAIRAAIQNIDVAFDKVSQSRSQIGARQNTLAAVKESNTDFKDFAAKSISDLEDLDYSEAYVRLQTSLMSYQAGMQASGKVAGLSLFNYM